MGFLFLQAISKLYLIIDSPIPMNGVNPKRIQIIPLNQ